ncbi:hypothetical protein SBOR_0969 [Sclerotinia borealis F-4128]|uniref:Major facilitator superfamily (MFS) profile domain-containing protein n=1 Tax=Sclerotinia borealis (strain F-4128) TaxID=1432307 RepID=W9CS90_SCLBF|nr:hypothetical protein SBOR_0969 [Sclerotinia borealis F-4128]
MSTTLNTTQGMKMDVESQLESRMREDSLSMIDPEMERRVVRKMDKHLMPLIIGLSYLDRSNIGNAKIAGMQDDLHLDSDSYEWLLTIFYISYIIFEPLVLMWKVIPPHMWGAITVVGWALSATLQTAAYNWSGMMAARFFLGAFEASFAPGITFLLSFFYLRNELGLRCGFYLGAAPLATCFAGALAYGITSGHFHSIAAWRVLFLVEGLPAILAGILTWFLMPDSPEKAKFLTEEEVLVAQARKFRQVGTIDSERPHGIQWSEVGAAFLDLKNWITALMYFSCNVSFASLPVFLPTILAAMGFSNINAQGLSAPPYFLAFLVVILTTWLADKYSQRGYTILVLSLIGAAGYIMLAVSSSTGVRYAGVFLAASGIFPAIGNILPWVMNNQGSESKRGTGIAILNVVGQCGPLLGTRLYPSIEGPYYSKGMWVCAAFMLFNGALAMALRFLLTYENRKLDEKYEVVGDDVNGSSKDSRHGGNENDGPNFSSGFASAFETALNML